MKTGFHISPWNWPPAKYICSNCKRLARVGAGEREGVPGCGREAKLSTPGSGAAELLGARVRTALSPRGALGMGPRCPRGFGCTQTSFANFSMEGRLFLLWVRRSAAPLYASYLNPVPSTVSPAHHPTSSGFTAKLRSHCEAVNEELFWTFTIFSQPFPVSWQYL